MAAPTNLLSFDNEIFAYFAFYAALVLLKTLLMAVYTARFRMAKKVFANPEDAMAHSASEKQRQIKFDDPDVERVRRNHLNDLENVIPFVLLGLLYTLTGPTSFWALVHFRGFAISRIIHTIAYQFALPQPSRGFSWMVGYGICLSMAVQVIKFLW